MTLLRVAEAPLPHSEGEVAAAVFDSVSGRFEVKRWPRDTPGMDVSDPRTVVIDGRTWMTSISHLRVVRSADGVHFDVESAPALQAATELEAFGIEDPRITLLDGTYWINHTAVSPHGIANALASTERPFLVQKWSPLLRTPRSRRAPLSE